MSSSEQLMRALERADWVALVAAAAGAAILVGAALVVRSRLARRAQWRLLLNVLTGVAVLAALASYFAIFDGTSSFLTAKALLAFEKQHGFPERTREQVLTARARDRMVIDTFEEVTLFTVPPTTAYPTWVAVVMGPASVCSGILVSGVLNRRGLRA